MKYGRCKWLYSSLLLVARDAARRFAFGHHNASGPNTSWRPFILRWRRRRKHLPKPLTGRTVPLGPTVWFPQFHFHYQNHLGNSHPRERWPDSAPASGVSQTRILLDHRWTTVRDSAGKRESRHVYRTLRPFYPRYSSSPEIETGEPLSTVRSRLPMPLIAPAHQHRKATQRFEQLPKVAGASYSQEIRIQPLQTRLQIWRHWQQTFRARPPMLGDRVPQPSPERIRERVKFDSPEELVWRRKQRPPVEVVDFEPGQVTSDRSQDPGLHTSQSEVAARLPVAVERAALPQVTKLDPGFLDRLTEDVIRRVEQRARIERQRRGL